MADNQVEKKEDAAQLVEPDIRVLVVDKGIKESMDLTRTIECFGTNVVWLIRIFRIFLSKLDQSRLLEHLSTMENSVTYCSAFKF